LEDRRNFGESICNFGDGMDQRVQSLMFMMMMMMNPSMRGTEDTCFQEFASTIFRKPTIQVPADVNTNQTSRVA